MYCFIYSADDPEFGVEFTAIDWVQFAEACGGKGYAIKEPNEVKSKLHQARKPTTMLRFIRIRVYYD
jgi:thiamine pyrophosphate-dependent acetolactate synthase large subunit-like protein